ncbi:MAG: SLC13 family permease [Candidatus Hydrogenedentes bacterium]|nr:SLC13 family permease [Candidatus Hydrogenedentota bacterium]
MWYKILSITIFTSAYILFFIFPNKRSLSAFVCAVICLATGTIPLREALYAIDLNVLGIFVGMLFIADFFTVSKCPAYLATILAHKTQSVPLIFLSICILTSFISAFVENVATVLIIAPICFEITKRLNINPTILIIAIAISSNLQGTATLIGDPPSMILAGYTGMNFIDFFVYHGKPGIFFAIQIGAIFTLIYLYFLFKKFQAVSEVEIERVTTWFPTILLVILIALLAIASVFEKSLLTSPGLICCIVAMVGICWAIFSKKVSIRKTMSELDWDTTFFLIGVFILVGVLSYQKLTNDIAEFIFQTLGKSPITTYTCLIVISVILSGFVDNVPYISAMLPIAKLLAEKGGYSPTLLYFGLLIGSCLGGNLTPIGASANIVGCGLLRKKGYEVSILEWLKISIPFTILAVVPASIFIWWIWK